MCIQTKYSSIFMHIQRFKHIHIQIHKDKIATMMNEIKCDCETESLSANKYNTH